MHEKCEQKIAFCAVGFADGAFCLYAEGSRFAGAVFEKRAPFACTSDNPELCRWAELFASHIKECRALTDEEKAFVTERPPFVLLPAFARDVLLCALAIPPGEVSSYGEIAAKLGKPGAARAVGRALACNPIPVLIPCHRILPKPQCDRHRSGLAAHSTFYQSDASLSVVADELRRMEVGK